MKMLHLSAQKNEGLVGYWPFDVRAHGLLLCCCTTLPTLLQQQNKTTAGGARARGLVLL